MSTEEQWSPPAEFDDYRLIRPIGQGSMGLVFLARDVVLERPVAVKFLTLKKPNRVKLERFRIEARAAARLQHPNVIAVHRIGELDQHPYIVTEFVRGQSLADLRLPIALDRALEIGLGLARGLAIAHRKGVLHRDIKLANAIVSEDGEVKLLDFSLAKLLDRELFTARDTAPAEGPAVDIATAARIKAGELNDTIRKTPDVPMHPSSLLALSELAGTPINELTIEGTLMGTPHYMAPELWRAEAATRRSDVYALGALMHYLVSGDPPFEADSPVELAMMVQQEQPQPIAKRVADIDPRFAEVIDKCLRFDPADRYRSGEELRNALELITMAEAQPQNIPQGNPYRGLRAFDAEHRSMFFGREIEITSVVERLRSDAFVLVAGDSGVGKSSLCRAGVMPQIAEGALAQGRTWSSARLVPGRHPLYALLSAIESGLEFDAESSFRNEITEDPALLSRILRRKLGRDRGKVIFIDQFEELVTISDPDEANIVGAIISQIAAGIPGVKLLATVRGDFLTRVAQIESLGAEIEEAVFLLRPMSPESMRRAIVGPAGLRQVTFTPEDVIDELVDEGIRGSLPLLQFALAELWEVRDVDQRVITRVALEQIGGVTGALARHADDMLARLLPTQRAAAKRLLMRLVTIEETRASLLEDELIAGDDAGRTALEALVSGRLVVARETDEGTIYEIAHEALIRGWKTLLTWLDEERENREIRRRLEIAARDWDRLQRSPTVLWSHQQLEEASGLEEASLAPRERDFVSASWSAHRRRVWRRRIALLSVPVLAVLTYVGFQLQARFELERKIDEHVAIAVEALNSAQASLDEVENLQQQAFTAFDGQDMAKGEELWAQARKLAGALEPKLKTSTQELETAIRLNPDRVDASDLLADALYARARFFDNRFNRSQRDEMIERLRLYDRDGSRIATWFAPGKLAVSTSTAAEVTLRSYTRGPEGSYQLGEARSLGSTPLTGLELEPGSHVLSFAAADHVDISYPVYIHRGQERAVEFEIPRVDDVPPGYVYIPAGRSFYGCPGDEGMRKNFYNAVPAHEVETGAYLIGRHEVTYAEWIEFLDALPDEERASYLPTNPGDSFRPGVELERMASGTWQITMTIEGQKIVAKEGEKVAYPRRPDDRQDWRQMPIGGVDEQKSEAFLKWLDSSGKLAGARMCSEIEWERAARGADYRLFPAGDTLQPGEANFDRTHNQRAGDLGTDEVGRYAQSRSPMGVDDLAGNVWEWVHGVQQDAKYVARGGGYSMPNLAAISINRQPLQAEHTSWSDLGLRVCATWK